MLSATQVTWEEACRDKLRFLSERAARRALVQLIGLKGSEDPMEVYECPYCFWWHYGHTRLQDGVGLVRVHIVPRSDSATTVD